MKATLLASVIILFISCSTKTHKPEATVKANMLAINVDTPNYTIDKGNLTGKTVTIDAWYGAIECTCPQWFETKDANDTINGRQSFYLEQGKENIIDSDTLYNGANYPLHISLTGQFYAKDGYPKNYRPTKGNPRPARVFRYEKINILKRVHHNF